MESGKKKQGMAVVGMSQCISPLPTLKFIYLILSPSLTNSGIATSIGIQCPQNDNQNIVAIPSPMSLDNIPPPGQEHPMLSQRSTKKGIAKNRAKGKLKDSLSKTSSHGLSTG